MSQDVVKQEKNLPSTQSTSSEQVLKSDVVIPKLLLMQGLSELVAARKAAQGDMVRSTTGEKLGDDTHPVQVIPLTFQNLWMLSEKIGNKYEFRGYEPRTSANEAAPWDFKAGGTDWKRTKVMNLFALLPADIEAQKAAMAEFETSGNMDLDKVLLPVVIPFRNTSFKAGKDIATLFAKAEAISRQVGKTIPAYGNMVSLKCEQQKNDKGAFFVFATEPAGKTSPEHREAAASWYGTLSSGAANIQVDAADESEAAADPTVGASF